MKNILLGLSLCLLLPLHVRADGAKVTYAEVIFGCDGLKADVSGNAGLNVADEAGEVRVQGLGRASIALDGNQLVLNTSDQNRLVIGTLPFAPACEVEDTGEAAHPSWNQVTLSNTVVMTLQRGNQTTLTVTDLQTQKQYAFSW